MHPRYKREFFVGGSREEPLTRSDLTLPSGGMKKELRRQLYIVVVHQTILILSVCVLPSLWWVMVDLPALMFFLMMR